MKKIMLLSIISVSILNIQAQDRNFARTYGSTVLPKGSIDIEFWHTSRFGHAGQFFHAQDQRMELEFGLGKDVQTAFYFNRFQQRFSEGANGTTTSNEIGFSNEWKWRFQPPKRKVPGMALYGEWGIKGGDELELELKFIADRNFGKNMLAFNAVVEHEREFTWKNSKLKSDDWESPVEFDLAYMYNINRTWGIGMELRNFNAIGKGNGWEYSILSGGPTITYWGDRYFIIANYLPQWINLHKTSEAPGNKVLNEQERAEARILLGISL